MNRELLKVFTAFYASGMLHLVPPKNMYGCSHYIDNLYELNRSLVLRIADLAVVNADLARRVSTVLHSFQSDLLMPANLAFHEDSKNIISTIIKGQRKVLKTILDFDEAANSEQIEHVKKLYDRVMDKDYGK